MAYLPSLNSLKPGIYIVVRGEPCLILTTHFMRMQQRQPVMQTKLRNLLTGKVLEIAFHPGDKVEEAEIIKTHANFLYKDERSVYLMEEESYEQIAFLSEQVAGHEFLKEGQAVEILKFNERPINVLLPTKVELKVTSAAPAVRGDSAAGNVLKEITLETGAIIKAPIFVKEGDIIRVKPETGEYAERVTE